MTPGWAGGVTRGRLLLTRTIGPDHARALAGRSSLADAVAALAASAYGERVQAGCDIAAAQRGVAETLLWHLRVLAGWLPAAGVRLMRALCAWFELQNIDARLAALAGGTSIPSPFALGHLSTAWPSIEPALSIEDMVDAIDRSEWGKTGGGARPDDLAIGLRVRWAQRVGEAAPALSRWVDGGGALLVARELLVAGSRAHVDQLRRLPGVTDDALSAISVPELRSALGAGGAWVLADTAEPLDLWRAELGWWSDLQRRAPGMLRATDGASVVLAVAALLAGDAQRTARALAAAAGGGGPELVELAGAAG